MYWDDINSASTDDAHNELFGQYVDFGHDDVEGSASASSIHDFGNVATSMFVMDDSAQNPLDSALSSGLSSADGFEFLSGSSHVDAIPGQEIDPNELAIGSGDEQQYSDSGGRASMSETDLSRLEGISLQSPVKSKFGATSGPSSPTPPDTETRKGNKLVGALSSTIKKATNLRSRAKKGGANSPPRAEQAQVPQLKIPKQRRGRTRAVTHGNLPASPPFQHKEEQLQQQQLQINGPAEGGVFIHGQYEDPFESPLQPPGPMFFHGQVTPDTPTESPGIKNEPGQFPGDIPWQQQTLQWTGAGGDYVTDGTAWWSNGNGVNSGAYTHHARSASIHVMDGQHNQFDYMPMPDTSAGGLMIHMPQPRGAQGTAMVNDLTVNAQTYLPPPPPAQQVPKIPQSERSHRPPKAKSAGARHLSCSPVRRAGRGPSASPGPGDGPRTRHSSGGSVSSTRSASGRLPNNMPGTPCSVRKRRSRDVSGAAAAAVSAADAASASGLSGGGVGFVNFTPNDGSMLMTGVAPSGSSKTKARREKEATERRRRLSEAAIKAVAAAGGDVDKLLEQGFTF